MGIVGLALILYEGGLQTSWRRLRAVPCRPPAEHGRRHHDRGGDRGRRAYVLFDLSGGGRSCWARSSVLRMPQRSSPPSASPASAAASRARWRPSRASTTRWPSPSRSGLIAWIRDQTATGWPTCCGSSSSKSASASSSASRWLAASWVFALLPPPDRSVCPGLRPSPAARSFGAAGVLDGSGFLAVYLTGLPPGAHRPATGSPGRIPRGPRLPRPSRALHRARPARFPGELSGVPDTGSRLAARARVPVRPAAVCVSIVAQGVHIPRTCAAGLGRPPRRRPIVLATFVLSSDVTPCEHHLQRCLLRRRDLRQSCRERPSNGSLGRLGLSLRITTDPGGHRSRSHGAHQARSRRLPRRARPRDRRCRRPRGRPPAYRDHCRRRSRRRLDPASRQHTPQTRRPALRPGSPL